MLVCVGKFIFVGILNKSFEMGAKMAFAMVLTSLLLVAAPVLVVVWVFMYRGGYVWKGSPEKEFNWHPTFMVSGFIFYSGFSMLFYRMMSGCRKIYVKLLHMIFHGCAKACIILGFLTVYPAKKLIEMALQVWNWKWDEIQMGDQKARNFYSLHSWLGLMTIALFFLQFIVGFFSFIICSCRGTSSCRASLTPVHSAFGLIIFIMAATTACVGLMEKAILDLGQLYNRWGTPEALFINVIGITIAAATIAMVFTISVPSMRKKRSMRNANDLSHRPLKY